MLEIRNVTKIYRSKSGAEVKALDNVSISFAETGMVFVLGKSGSGKSTLLNVIGGLDGCDSGEFVIKGKSSKQFMGSDFDAYRNTFIGFIFQEYNILDDFTVGANIGLALELQGKKADNKKISEILKEVDLLDYAKRKPNELSGGQKQRVAIARALVKDPEIIMADEPTGALDSNTGKQIFDTLKELSKTKLVIVVSHDRDFAERYGDRIIEMKDGQVFSDVTRHAVSAEEIGDGILKMNDNLLRIEKGYQLTARDVEMINEYLRTRESDILISSDRRVNDGVRSAAGIAEDNTSSVFDKTNEEKDVKKKDYSGTKTKFIRSRLPMKNALRMGGNSLGHKKFRLVVTVLLSLIAFALFGFADTMGSYNKCRAAVDSIRDSNIRYAAFSLGVRESYIYPNGKTQNYYNQASMNEGDVAFLKEKLGSTFIPVFNGSSDTYTTISISQMMIGSDALEGAYQDQLYGFVAPTESQISDLGYTVTGTLPAAENEVAISKLVYEMLNANGFRNGSHDEEVKAGSLTMNVGNDKNSIIGKHLSLYLNGWSFDYTITAVIDTGFDYNRYASFIPDQNKQDGVQESGGIAEMILEMELQNALRYGFHNLGFVSQSGLEKLENSIVIYNYTFVGTSMDGWNVALRTDEEMGGMEVMWFRSVAGSEALSDASIKWLDGTERTTLGDKEMVVSADILNRLNDSADLTEMTYGLLREAFGSYWKDEYEGGWFEETVAFAALDEEIDKYFDTYKTTVAEISGWWEPTDEDIRIYWRDNYEYVRESIENCPMKSRDELIVTKLRPIAEELLGETLVGQIDLGAVKDPYAYTNYLNQFVQGTVSSYSLTDFAINLYAYGEAYTQGDEIYEDEAFRAYVIERWGYKEEDWEFISEDEKCRIAADIIAQYVRNSQYDSKEIIFVPGGGGAISKPDDGGSMDGGSSYTPNVDKTYHDFAPAARDQFFVLSGGSIEEMLGKFYLRVSDWWDGEENSTDYRDFKIVGVYEGLPNTEIVICDTLVSLYEDFCVENNIAKHESYPHEAGSYAYALGVMPTDEDKILELVEFSYDESEGLSFTLRNQVMDTLGNFNDFIEIGAKVFLYVGIGFAVFSALMLMNFISISISYKRREIGILRAVGARSSDVFKIFFSEAFMIALINYTLSLAATVAGVTVFNRIVRNEGLNVTLLHFGVRQVILMFVISLGVAAVASFLPVWNIARRKPVDAIKNK